MRVCLCVCVVVGVVRCVLQCALCVGCLLRARVRVVVQPLQTKLSVRSSRQTFCNQATDHGSLQRCFQVRRPLHNVSENCETVTKTMRNCTRALASENRVDVSATAVETGSLTETHNCHEDGARSRQVTETIVLQSGKTRYVRTSLEPHDRLKT